MRRGAYGKARVIWREREALRASKSKMSESIRLSWLDPVKRQNRVKAITEAWDDPLLRAIERAKKS